MELVDVLFCWNTPDPSGKSGSGVESGGSQGPNSVAGNPKTFKDWFYKNFQDILTACIKDVFGKDAGGVLPQNSANAPILDTTQTKAQLTSKVPHASGPVVGLNDASLGKYGTVYIASEWYYGKTSGTLNAIAGTYTHELGNLLDAKLHPSPSNYELNYGNRNNPFDKDTGMQLETCMFGGPQQP